MAFKYSIGNLGESEKICIKVKLASNFVNLRCTFGQIDQINEWGVY